MSAALSRGLSCIMIVAPPAETPHPPLQAIDATVQKNLPPSTPCPLCKPSTRPSR